jgi:hypothetical protein
LQEKKSHRGTNPCRSDAFSNIFKDITGYNFEKYQIGGKNEIINTIFRHMSGGGYQVINFPKELDEEELRPMLPVNLRSALYKIGFCLLIGKISYDDLCEFVDKKLGHSNFLNEDNVEMITTVQPSSIKEKIEVGDGDSGVSLDSAEKDIVEKKLVEGPGSEFGVITPHKTSVGGLTEASGDNLGEVVSKEITEVSEETPHGKGESEEIEYLEEEYEQEEEGESDEDVGDWEASNLEQRYSYFERTIPPPHVKIERTFLDMNDLRNELRDFNEKNLDKFSIDKIKFLKDGYKRIRKWLENKRAWYRDRGLPYPTRETGEEDVQPFKEP